MEEKLLGRKKRPAADCEVRGGSATHDLDSRSIMKLNAEEEEEDNILRTLIKTKSVFYFQNCAEISCPWQGVTLDITVFFV